MPTDRHTVRSTIQIIHALVEAALDFAAPPHCAACDEPTMHRDPFCTECDRVSQQRAQHGSVGGVALWAAGAYVSPLSDAIRRFKYDGRPDLARPLSRFVTPALSELMTSGGELLVPVPLHPRRLAERGYNQAALLARELARANGLSSRPLALLRRRHTLPQVGRSRADRILNVAGIFAVREQAAVRGKEVILVDDVATTGATLSACIRVLEAAGADVRGALLLARATEAGLDR
jgi:ComF family protein